MLGLRRNALVLSDAAARAEVAIALGKAETAPSVLLPFAYEMLTPPSPAELSQAVDLLAQIGEEGFSAFNIRERFLRLALPLLGAEARAECDAGTAKLWAEGFERLEKMLEDGEHGTWLQKHLLPFFAGRAHELAGAQEQALEAYLRSLELCPGNIYVLLRLESCRQSSRRPGFSRECPRDSGVLPGIAGDRHVWPALRRL